MNSYFNLKDCVAAVAIGLGDQLNVKVQFGENQLPCTDGETIFMPNSVMHADPVWVWGFLVHEAAHIRYTSFDDALTARYYNEVREGCARRGIPPLSIPFDLFHTCWNGFEDAMIERLILEPFPGVEDYFLNLRQALIQKGAFHGPKPGINNPFAIVVSYAFYRAFYLCSKQTAYAEIYAQWHRLIESVIDQNRLIELDNIIDRNATAQTTEENFAITRDLFWWLAKLKMERSSDSSSDQSSPQMLQGQSQSEHGQKVSDSAQSSEASENHDDDASSETQDEQSPLESDPTASQEDQPSQAGDKQPKDSTPSDSQNESSDATNQEEPSSQGQGKHQKGEPEAQNGQNDGQSNDQQGNESLGVSSDEQASSDDKACQSASSDDQCSESQSSNAQSNIPASSSGQLVESDLDWSNMDPVDMPTTIENEVSKQFEQTSVKEEELDQIIAKALMSMGSTLVLKEKRDSLLEECGSQTTLNAVAQTQRIFDALKRHVYAIGAKQRANRRAGKRFNIRKINRLMAGDLSVFRAQVPHMEPNAHVKILIDMSGSMNSGYGFPAIHALTGALSIYQAFQLGKATIPVTIDTFGSKPLALTFQNESALATKQILSKSKVNLGNTALAQAMVFSGMDLARQRQKRKVLLVLTDGAPTDCHLDSEVFTELLELLKRSGIEVFFIGISLKRFTLEKLYSALGQDRVADVRDINTLADEMFNTIGQRMCEYLNA